MHSYFWALFWAWTFLTYEFLSNIRKWCLILGSNSAREFQFVRGERRECAPSPWCFRVSLGQDKKTGRKEWQKRTFSFWSKSISANMNIIHEYSASKRFPSSWELNHTRWFERKPKSSEKIIQTRSDDCVLSLVSLEPASLVDGWRTLEISLSSTRYGQKPDSAPPGTF